MFDTGYRVRAFVALCLTSTLVLPSLLLAQGSERDLRLNTFSDTGRLTLSGSATVIDNRSLLLTPSENWQAGSVFSSQKISTEEFSTFFAFRISDPGGGGADGIALIAQTVSASLGEVGGGMGYEGVPNSLAVEFDTWRNNWDADDNHTGLLLNGDVSHRDFPAVPLPASLENGEIWYAWVDYDGSLLSLRLSQTRQRPEAAIFEHLLDIPAILNSPVAYVGFASGTGAARARHEVLEWTYLERFAPTEISEAQEIAAELSVQRSVELDIQFEFNSDIPTADGFERIARFSEGVAQTFDTIPDLIILGHTDAVGSASYNLSLSQRRANAVRDTLIQRHGFPPERLTAEGRGETELKFPLNPEADGNRRVEVRLSDDAHFPVAAPVPAHRDAEEHFPTALHGSYAPDGDCARWPRATVAQGHVEFYGWEGGDILFLDQWRACPDCLPEYPLAASELRIAPVIAEGDPKAAPVFRFNANGVPGLMLAEGGGDMTKFPELAAVVDFGVLARCDVSRIEAAATLDPTAEASWRSFENDSRAGASYCPVLDNTAQNQMCFDLGCGFGRRIDWALGIMGSPAGFVAPRDSAIEAEIVIDNSVVGRMTFTRPDDDPNAQFYAPFDFETHGITLVQLQNGREAELRLSAEGQTAAVLMGLRGSSRALDGIMQMCGERLMAANPINRPDRFLSQQGASQPEAERLAREALAATLAEMNTQATPPIVDVQTAWLIDLGDGWRFILTDVGPSNFHFGMGGYGGFVLAAPPGEPFRRVGPDANASIIWIDQEQRNMGWPRLLFQSGRGMNPPFHAWRWNGQNYIYDREIQP